MSQDKNIFGGANPLGLYVPMSEDEREVIARLVEEDDLEVVVTGWGIYHARVTFGDLRVTVYFRMDFDRPAVPLAVHYFDLTLRTGSGLILFTSRYPVGFDGKPLEVAAGMFLDLAWDIALDHMDPAIVKALKPGAFGITSRRLDRDTGERTVTGNMRMTPNQRTLLNVVEEGAAEVRQSDAEAVAAAETKASTKTKV